METVKITQEGLDFPRGYFEDWNGDPCVIALSSLADDRCIWIGRIDNLNGRMLLNIEQVKSILPVLERFVNHGDINENTTA